MCLLDPEILTVVAEPGVTRVGLPLLEAEVIPAITAPGQELYAWRSGDGRIYARFARGRDRLGHLFDWTATWGTRHRAASDPVLVEARNPVDAFLVYRSTDGAIVVASVRNFEPFVLSDIELLRRVPVGTGVFGARGWLSDPMPDAIGKPAAFLDHRRRLHVVFRSVDGRLILAVTSDPLDRRRCRAYDIDVPVRPASDPVAIHMHLHTQNEIRHPSHHRGFGHEWDRPSLAFRGEDGNVWFALWEGPGTPVAWDNLTERLMHDASPPVHETTTGELFMWQSRLAFREVDAITVIVCPTTDGYPIVFVSVYDWWFNWLRADRRTIHWRAQSSSEVSTLGAPPAIGPVAAIADPIDQHVHLFYKGTDSHLHRLSFRLVFLNRDPGNARRGSPTFSSWRHADLTETLRDADDAAFSDARFYMPRSAPTVFKDEDFERLWDNYQFRNEFTYGSSHPMMRPEPGTSSPDDMGSPGIRDVSTTRRIGQNFQDLFVPFIAMGGAARDGAVMVARRGLVRSSEARWVIDQIF